MIKTAKARQLCTKVELALYLQSLPREVKKLTAVRLGQKVKRARDLRDKYRKLAKQQAREARGKAKPRGARPASGSLRTQEKQQLFAETLERFQVALRTAPKATARTVKKAAPGKKKVVRKTVAKKVAKKKVTSRKPTARGKVRRTSVKREASAKAVRFKRGGKMRAQAHTSSRTRRTQARSDARGR
jgi:hypothetical protein